MKALHQIGFLELFFDHLHQTVTVDMNSNLVAKIKHVISKENNFEGIY